MRTVNYTYQRRKSTEDNFKERQQLIDKFRNDLKGNNCDNKQTYLDEIEEASKKLAEDIDYYNSHIERDKLKFPEDDFDVPNDLHYAESLVEEDDVVQLANEAYKRGWKLISTYLVKGSNMVGIPDRVHCFFERF